MMLKEEVSFAVKRVCAKALRVYAFDKEKT
jgi:hypothetical protein